MVQCSFQHIIFLPFVAIEKRMMLIHPLHNIMSHLVLCSIDWAAVIVDEAHKIKNPKSQITQAMKDMRCKVRVGLTGTILQNNLEELWCVMDWWGTQKTLLFLTLIEVLMLHFDLDGDLGLSFCREFTGFRNTSYFILCHYSVMIMVISPLIHLNVTGPFLGAWDLWWDLKTGFRTPLSMDKSTPWQKEL